MTPPRSIIGGVLESSWFHRPWRRRLVFAVLAALFGVLSIWPQHYKAEAQLLPQDSGGGLSAALASQGSSGGLLSLGALLGNKQPVEADLSIARSHAVLGIILDRLHLVGRAGYGDRRHAEARLKNKLGIIAIRGSILQITASDRDVDLARALAATTASAIQDRLGAISLIQAAQKRAVAEIRLSDATARLARTQAALGRFRTENRLAAPAAQLGAAVGLLAALEGRLQAKQVEVATLREFARGDNIKLRTAEVELGAIRNQVAAAKIVSPTQQSSNLAGIAETNTTYFNLYRDEKSAETLFEVYRRYLEEISVDELSANQNLVLVEPAYIYPERQFNAWAVGLLVIDIFLLIIAEYYVALPPIGRRAIVVG